MFVWVQAINAINNSTLCHLLVENYKKNTAKHRYGHTH